MRKSKRKSKEKMKKITPLIPTCYKCGKKGYIKPYFPLFKNEIKNSEKLRKRRKCMLYGKTMIWNPQMMKKKKLTSA